MIPLKLAKIGYFGGDPSKVAGASIIDVMNVLDYENFTVDFENAYFELNKGE